VKQKRVCKSEWFMQCVSTFLLQRNLPQMFVLEPYAMIQVSILLSVTNLWNSGIVTTAQNCGCEFRPRQFLSVSVEPLAATHGTLRFRGNPIDKHWFMVTNLWWQTNAIDFLNTRVTNEIFRLSSTSEPPTYEDQACSWNPLFLSHPMGLPLVTRSGLYHVHV